MVFESTKDLVTMKRAALFKKKNYGKLISDVSIVTEILRSPRDLGEISARSRSKFCRACHFDLTSKNQ